MRAKEFEAWLSRNVGKGGKRPSLDPYNKAKKGSERNPTAQEYANQSIEEYHHYSGTKDTRNEKDEKDDKKKDSSNSSQSRNSSTRSAANSTQSLARNIVSRVAAVSVGAVVVVNGYQAIQENEAKKVAAPIVAEVVWTWSEDNSAATIGVYDDKGNLIREIPAEVVISSEVFATCTTGGERTYSATVKDEDGTTYSDTKTEPVPATGHKFGEGREIDLGDGQSETEYECEHCHEKFVISTTVTED